MCFSSKISRTPFADIKIPLRPERQQRRKSTGDQRTRKGTLSHHQRRQTCGGRFGWTWSGTADRTEPLRTRREAPQAETHINTEGAGKRRQRPSGSAREGKTQRHSKAPVKQREIRAEFEAEREPMQRHPERDISKTRCITVRIDAGTLFSI